MFLRILENSCFAEFGTVVEQYVRISGTVHRGNFERYLCAEGAWNGGVSISAVSTISNAPNETAVSDVSTTSRSRARTLASSSCSHRYVFFFSLASIPEYLHLFSARENKKEKAFRRVLPRFDRLLYGLSPLK